MEDVEGGHSPIRGGANSPDVTTQSSSAGLAGLGAAMGAGAGACIGAGAESSRQQAGPLPSKRTSLERDTLRIMNPATASDGTTADDPPRETRPRSQEYSNIHNRQRTFRRHEDAGRWRMPEQDEVVDLPPLYTDIRRDSENNVGHH
jgi:hypothetical protein